jgi:hypothetical protein
LAAPTRQPTKAPQNLIEETDMGRGSLFARRLVAGAAALSLGTGSATPAVGQEFRSGVFDGPRAANATLNVRVPLGGGVRAGRPTLGFTVGLGREFGSPEADGRRAVRQLRLADFRLGEDGLARARIVGLEVGAGRSRGAAAAAGQTPTQTPTQTPAPDPNVEFPEDRDTERKKNAGLAIIALLVGLGVYLLAEGDGSTDDSEDEESPGLSNGG